MQDEAKGPGRDSPAPDFEARLDALTRRVEYFERLKAQFERKLLGGVIGVAIVVVTWIAFESVELYALWKRNHG